MSGKGHRHEIIVRSGDGRELRFAHLNHDDLLEIATRLRAGSDLEPDAAAALAIGLKLLAETVMPRRAEPPYDALWPVLATFTRALKASLQTDEPRAVTKMSGGHLSGSDAPAPGPVR